MGIIILLCTRLAVSACGSDSERASKTFHGLGEVIAWLSPRRTGHPPPCACEPVPLSEPVEPAVGEASDRTDLAANCCGVGGATGAVLVRESPPSPPPAPTPAPPRVPPLLLAPPAETGIGRDARFAGLPRAAASSEVELEAADPCSSDGAQEVSKCQIALRWRCKLMGRYCMVPFFFLICMAEVIVAVMVVKEVEILRRRRRWWWVVVLVLRRRWWWWLRW
jgi:hypothetical protein